MILETGKLRKILFHRLFSNLPNLPIFGNAKNAMPNFGKTTNIFFSKMFLGEQFTF